MTLVNLGSTAWHVVEGGKPSASLVSNACNAVPAGVTAFTDVQGPNTVVWSLTRTNGHGLDVVDVAFGLRWEYGARHGGAGAYIPNCYLYVPRCSVLWGYSVDVSLYVHPPEEADEIARLPLTVSGTVSSLLRDEPVRWDFWLDGDGRYHVD
jgi:hypothetical protein